MSVAPQIKGWCPSAWRPMLTGDGYLVRLHFSCGIVTSDQARAIARLSQAHGNGLIDLTRRANLQIRGVSEEHIPELQAELVGENLIAEDAAAETVPNVIASPLAGRDREALIDIRPVVRELERHLASDLHARDLPAKFCITVDDGGRFSLRDIDADISFEACRARLLHRAGRGRLCRFRSTGSALGGRTRTHPNSRRDARTECFTCTPYAGSHCGGGHRCHRVMPGLEPGIHGSTERVSSTWIAGSGPALTRLDG